MTDMAEHRKPSAHRDHVWVLVIIAGFAMYDVWQAWALLGNKSGFAHGTGWTLTVIVEAYWAYALFAWFSAPGPLSRRFAMGSAAFVFTLSLVGQASSRLTAHRMPPAAVVVFVSVLPVIVLAAIAVLIHLRRLDRENEREAERRVAEAERRAVIERAEADEQVTLRAALDAAEAEREAMRAELAETAAQAAGAEASRAAADAERSAREAADAERDAAVSARESAEKAAAEALTRAEALAQKLERLSARQERKKTRASAQASARDNDITNELLAVMELQANPDLCRPRMGAELARKLSIGASTGRRLHGKLTENGALSEYAKSLTGSPGERSADDSDARSGERS